MIRKPTYTHARGGPEIIKKVILNEKHFAIHI